MGQIKWLPCTSEKKLSGIGLLSIHIFQEVVHGTSDNFGDGLPREIPVLGLSPQKRGLEQLAASSSGSLIQMLGKKLPVTGCGTKRKEASGPFRTYKGLCGEYGLPSIYF
jgi:hypothetical protein